MPRGPQGQKRPADVNRCAVHVARIATGEIEETYGKPRQPNKAKGGKIGGKRRAESLTSDRRGEIALAAAHARWGD